MAVKIRLKRVGKIRTPHYRIVVADARTKRDGRVIEEIGTYNPKTEPSTIKLQSERAQYWLGVGAQPTEAVAAILRLTGDIGGEATVREPEPRPDKAALFDAALKEMHAEPKAAKKTAKKAAKKADDAKVDEPKAKKKAEEPKADEAKAEDAPAEEPKADEAKAEEPKADEAKAEEPQAEADEAKAEEPKADEAKADEGKAEEPKAEEAAAEEPKTDESPEA